MSLYINPEDISRVLVSRTDGLGDCIVTLPMAVALRELFPEAEIGFLVSEYTAPLVERIQEIDMVLTLPESGSARKVISGYAPDIIVFARPEFRLAVDAARARVPIRIGTGRRLYSSLFNRWVYDHRKTGELHESEYGVRLLGPLAEELPQPAMPELPVSISGAQETQQQLAARNISAPYIVIHPGNKGSASAYPPEQYAQVALTFLQQAPDITVIITAGPHEAALAEAIVEHIGNGKRATVISGLSLNGFSELLRRAASFVGSSSGPAHLAALVGTPVVALYPSLPPVWPTRWRPLGKQVTVLTPRLDDPLCPDCGTGHKPEHCVARIPAQRIVEMLQQMALSRRTVE